MKYKITAALLACFMLLAALSACSKGKDDKDTDDTKSNIPVLTPGQSTTEEDPVDPSASSTTAATSEDPSVSTPEVTTTAATTPEATTTAATTTAATTTAATTTEAPAVVTFTDCNKTVYVIAAALNLRTSPAVKADNIYNQVTEGTALTCTGTSENWCRVVLEGKEYYVSATYVSDENPAAEVEFTVRYETVYVTADSLYIREAPNSNGKIYDTVSKGTELIRIGYHEVWSKVMYGDKLLYCGTKYLSTENPLAAETTAAPAVG